MRPGNDGHIDGILAAATTQEVLRVQEMDGKHDGHI